MRRWLNVLAIVLFAHVAAAEPAKKFEAGDLPLNLKSSTGQTAEWLRSYTAEPRTFSYEMG